MKKIIIAMFLFLMPIPSHADGPFDGIWSFSPYGFVSVTERNGIIVAINVNNKDFGGDWEAVWGERVGNAARVTTLVGEVSAVSDVVLTSDTTLTVTQISCVPINADYVCNFPDGFTIEGEKVW